MSKKRKLADAGSRKLVQPIALDSSGRPVFPIVLGGLTVYSLGEVCVSTHTYASHLLFINTVQLILHCSPHLHNHSVESTEQISTIGRTFMLVRISVYERRPGEAI